MNTGQFGIKLRRALAAADFTEDDFFRFSVNVASLLAGYFKLDQTTPQTVIGYPVFPGLILNEKLGVGIAIPTSPIHLVLKASDAIGINIDGNIDYTGIGIPIGINIVRDYDAGLIELNTCCGISNYMYSKHSGANINATKYVYGAINRAISDGLIMHGGAGIRLFYQYGEYAWVDDRNVYDTYGAGPLWVTNTALKALADCTAGFVDSGGTGPTTSISMIAVDAEVKSHPSLGSGILYPLLTGVKVKVHGSTMGSSIAYGVLIDEVSGCDANIAVMDNSDAPWIKKPGTGATGVATGGAQKYVMDRGGVGGKASWYIKNEDDTADYYVGPLYGEMYDYENATAVVIGEMNVYHAINTIGTTGLCKGWTFKAGITGPIATFATYDGGAATLCTDVAHGLLSGEIVTISNSTNYNGAHVVTVIDPDNFTIPVAYVAEAGGPIWIRGSSLKADVWSAGIYKITWGTTCFPTGANDNYKVEPNLNTTYLDNMAASMRLTIAADRINMSGSGLVTVAEGDYIWFTTRNETAVSNITFRHFNCSIIKI